MWGMITYLSTNLNADLLSITKPLADIIRHILQNSNESSMNTFSNNTFWATFALNTINTQY